METVHDPTKVPGLAKAPKEKHLDVLEKYSKAELLELKDRQLKLLSNK